MFNHDFPNRDRYTLEMRKSLHDKMFWVDKINANIVVDFGCADGAMIGWINQTYPEIMTIGFDIDREMAAQARANTGAMIFTDIAALGNAIDSIRSNNKIAVILNSVLHEVYSYNERPQDIWLDIESLDPDYIVIRDMMIPNSIRDVSVDPRTVAQVRDNSDQRMLDDFERRWGSITTAENLTHYLLKYRYRDNWSRELNENYLSLRPTTILPAALGTGDRFATYYEMFRLPFLSQQVRQDFDVSFPSTTHFKLIAAR